LESHCTTGSGQPITGQDTLSTSPSERERGGRGDRILGASVMSSGRNDTSENNKHD